MGKYRLSRGGKRMYGSKTDTKKKTSIPKQIVNVKKSVAKIQNRMELKYKDTFLNDINVNSTALLTLLNGMVVGDTVSTREGDQYYITSVQMRAFYISAATNFDEPHIRHIIFWDSQANGAAPSSGDVLDLATITNPVIAPYKRQTQKRFKILYDKVTKCTPRTVNPTAATTEVVPSRVFQKAKIYCPRTVKIRNAQNNGTIADIETNSMYSLLVANTTGSNIIIDAGYRVYFKDN